MEKFDQLITKITKEQFDELKGCDKIELQCRICTQTFEQKKSIILKSFKQGYTSGFCSRNCSNKFKINKVNTECEECGKEISVRAYQRKTYKHSFCSYSCSAKYRNRHKTNGIIRSKIEIYIENKIKQNYPTLNVMSNDRILLEGLELDFYFPALKLGIELNGITHYEPIYGEDRLTRSKDSDKRKMIQCYENDIELAVIDVSGAKYLTQKWKDIYWNEVNQLLANLFVNNF